MIHPQDIPAVEANLEEVTACLRELLRTHRWQNCGSGSEKQLAYAAAVRAARRVIEEQ